MGVGIITVYNTENCGSALQAYALKETLTSCGEEVYFVYRDIRKTSHSLFRCILSVVKNSAQLDFQTAWFRIQRYRSFRKFQRSHFLTKKQCEVQDNDTVLIGSDTLWDLSSLYFRNTRALFWGETVQCAKRISYAVSIANAQIEDFEDDYYRERLKNIDRISVRDEHSKTVISTLTNKNVQIVCDPTLLLTAEDYDKLTTKTIHDKYMLVYYFGAIPAELKNEMMRFAKEKKLHIISLGEVRKWCDENVYYSPENLLSYYKNAAYVVTNTFHGTVFSVIYRKNFVSFVKNRIKIRDFLYSIGLEERILENTEKLPVALEQKEIYTDDIRACVSKLRDSSVKYIEDSL